MILFMLNGVMSPNLHTNSVKHVNISTGYIEYELEKTEEFRFADPSESSQAKNLPKHSPSMCPTDRLSPLA